MSGNDDLADALNDPSLDDAIDAAMDRDDAAGVKQKYRVNLSQSANLVFDVEAESPEQAIGFAEADAYAGLCNHCAHKIDLDPNGWDAVKDLTPEVVT